MSTFTFFRQNHAAVTRGTCDCTQKVGKMHYIFTSHAHPYLIYHITIVVILRLALEAELRTRYNFQYIIYKDAFFSKQAYCTEFAKLSNWNRYKSLKFQLQKRQPANGHDYDSLFKDLGSGGNMKQREQLFGRFLFSNLIFSTTKWKHGNNQKGNQTASLASPPEKFYRKCNVRNATACHYLLSTFVRQFILF